MGGDTWNKSASLLTWAQCGTGYFLHALPFAEGTTIEGCWVGAGPRAFLIPSSTAAITHRPLCPGGPTTVYWEEVNNNMWITCLYMHTDTQTTHNISTQSYSPRDYKKNLKFKARRDHGLHIIQSFITELKNLSTEIKKNELLIFIHLPRKANRIVFSFS